MLTAKKMMTTSLVTVTMDASLEEVRNLFEAQEFHHLVVVEKGRPVGVVSDRDVLRELSPFVGKMTERAADEATLHRKVHQIMSREIHKATEDTEACDLIQQMLENKIGCLPIVDENGWCQGIITWRDILGWCADEIFCVDRYCKADEDEDAGEQGSAQAA